MSFGDDTLYPDVINRSTGKPVNSVLQLWVMQLPLRQQGVLVLALRGPDGTRKESPVKPIVRSLRACVMVSGRKGTPMELDQKFDDDSFMRMDLISDNALWHTTCHNFFECMDELNLHYFQHLMHAALICAQHPNSQIGHRWYDFYFISVNKLHLKPETVVDMTFRLRNGKRPEADQ